MKEGRRARDQARKVRGQIDQVGLRARPAASYATRQTDAGAEHAM
jgi:hypothetical protein